MELKVIRLEFAETLKATGFDSPRGRARLALAVGVDPVTVWRWLSGRRAPNSDGTYVALAEQLGKTPDEIRAMFDGEPDRVAA